MIMLTLHYLELLRIIVLQRVASVQQIESLYNKCTTSTRRVLKILR